MKNKLNPTLIDEILAAISIPFMLLFSPLLRNWYSRWGAEEEEIKMPLPGDDLLPQWKLITTRAVEIQSAPQDIWPWLVQLGQNKGGLYSYERLENIAGCKMKNADQVIPEFQTINKGDKVTLGPEGYPFYLTNDYFPEKHLILTGADPNGENLLFAWTFFLKPEGEKKTRLIVRSRTNYEPGFGNVLIWRVFTEPVSFVMERQMLWGIKARAESISE